ncbi:MAG: transporter substrate-binding domain-containing protein [Campylobacter sp.]|nr:transporter substrate-binding domain-containing protein [Campylobacter sp.]
MKKLLVSLFVLSSFVFSASLQEIQESKKVKIGIRAKLPPFSNQDENGISDGFEVSLAKEIAKKLVGEDGEIEFIVLNAKDRIPMLESGEIDIAVANFTKTPERAKKVDFSTPYLSNTQAVITRKIDKIENIKDLSGKRMLVTKATTSDDWLQINAQKYGLEVVYCNSVKECGQALADDEGDGYIHTNILNAAVPLNNDDLEMGIKSIGGLDYVCAGVVKGNTDLLKVINDTIIELSATNFFKDVYDDTFEAFYKGTVDRKHLLLDDLYKALLY